jgi:hypothetical protein
MRGETVTVCRRTLCGAKNELERTSVTATRLAALIVLSFYPIPFLIVASVVLIQWYYDRHAWVLAVLFGGFIAGTDLPNLLPAIHPTLRKALLLYWGALAVVPPGALYCFCACFPESTPLESLTDEQMVRMINTKLWGPFARRSVHSTFQREKSWAVHQYQLGRRADHSPVQFLVSRDEMGC